MCACRWLWGGLLGSRLGMGSVERGYGERESAVWQRERDDGFLCISEDV